MARGQGRGGYQKPRNPAAVSGPGAMSQRTDGRVPRMPYRGLPYGENQAVNEQQSAAPMSQGQAAPAGGGSAPRPGAQRPPDGVFAPTQRPNEPMTAGIDYGPGPGAPLIPPMDPDRNYHLRAAIAEVPELADYLLRLLDD